VPGSYNPGVRWALLLLLISGCAEDTCTRCTLDFEMVEVKVVNSAGERIVGATSSTIRVRDQKDLTPTGLMLEPGSYAVASDNNRHDYSSSPEDVVFRVDGGSTGSVQTTASVFTDECGCHVLYSGPETLTLQ
jgi:hypothetical protein